MLKQSDPIPVAEWKNTIQTQRAIRPRKASSIVLQTFDDPRGAPRRYRLRRRAGRLEVLASSREIGKHSFPPSIKVVGIGTRPLKELKDNSGGRYHPHLALRFEPSRLPKSLERPPFLWTPRGRRWANRGLPTSVYAPDTRYAFTDTSFPWSTCGRVDTGAGWGSGVMVGPRHVMTASHVVNWGSGNSAGWLKFTPLYFDGSAPFGSAYAIRTYFWLKADPSDGINAKECAFDYVVCVLDSRLGNVTGWMGSRGYSTSWNGGSYWAHVGYPADMAGGQRPVYHGPGKMDSTFTSSTSGRSSYGIKHKNDIWPGQSGGPFFGWWDGEAWPRVVSSQSAEKWGGSTGPNTCGGGNPLPYLINYARQQEP